MKPSNFKRNKQIRQDNANQREEYRKSISAKDQYFRLDRRLGENLGAFRERSRLYDLAFPG
jgi:hypothetical protein